MSTQTTNRIWVVQCNMGWGDGWEDLFAAETRQEALERLREYRENQPGTPIRLRWREEGDD